MSLFTNSNFLYQITIFFFSLGQSHLVFFFFFSFFRETSYVVIIMINHTLCWGPEIRDLIGPGVVQLEAQKHNLKSLWITHLDPFTKISNPALMVVQLLTRPSGLAYTWLWFGSHGPYFADNTLTPNGILSWWIHWALADITKFLGW